MQFSHECSQTDPVSTLLDVCGQHCFQYQLEFLESRLTPLVSCERLKAIQISLRLGLLSTE